MANSVLENLVDTIGLSLWMVGMGIKSLGLHMQIFEQHWSPLPEMLQRQWVLQKRLDVQEARVTRLRSIIHLISAVMERDDPSYLALVNAARLLAHSLEVSHTRLQVQELSEECMYPTKDIHPGQPWHVWLEGWRLRLKEVAFATKDLSLSIEDLNDGLPAQDITGRKLEVSMNRPKNTGSNGAHIPLRAANSISPIAGDEE
ncbi:hypothetical protein BJ684DRAFT_19447 [Piptocephalis cylindrospora]|uniref:Uncharacterized protein n=1 Tax=Piptocephalis cylindrospora TaxID=1907219 RepID=A0A4V1IYD0_9FUNG|nr:hypothetical protein BJ684DRAFT_19447 [Piptocephalis cylindrospora]|eukprot:RKP14129.1 hypothetical protein BJ684DRAFT_19447 [Piptocephalis cylindrospora]